MQMPLRVLALLPLIALVASAQTDNKVERLEWFRDQGFGLFIHWSVDSQLGVVISHSLAGASEGYKRDFFTDLPLTFNPRQFHPEDWAVLAKLAGIKYVVLTAKHHSGFAMWDTKSTPFNVLNTPFHRDIVRETLDAFRKQGIAPGLYFSPDDFWWLWTNTIDVDRRPENTPQQRPGLMAYDRSQLKELMGVYGNVDVLFFDGPAEGGLRELAWQMQPNVVVTRGAIATPEQYVPGVPLEGPWEACITMGTAWQYQPRNENYKSGWDVISLLVETRAKGGNLLLNVGPKPNGELPIEQEERLREVALWMFTNGESMRAVRPWVVTNENEIWYTKKKDENTVYAIVKLPAQRRWVRGEWKDLVLHSVKATAGTEVTVLGQNDKVLEYQPKVNPKTTWSQSRDGLHVRAMHTQRLQDNSKWPNPIVLKLTNVEPALQPPQVETLSAARESARTVLRGAVKQLGDAKEVEVSFEYRSLQGLDTNERSGAWTPTPAQRLTSPKGFSAAVPPWQAGVPYEFRAVVKHPLITMYGESKKATLK